MFITLFLAGLVGGFTHCSGMCGPFVMTQVIGKMNKVPRDSMGQFKRLQGAALIPYHLGRSSTYVFLAVISSYSAKHIFSVVEFRVVSIVLLVVAAIVFLSLGLGIANKYLPLKLQNSNNTGIIAKLSKPLFEKPTGASGYLLGVILGFIPCGLIFAALMAVVTIGNPIAAAFAMLAFAIGTIPALFIIGLGSNYLSRRWSNLMQRFARGVMVLNGIIILIMAGDILLEIY